MAGTVTSKEAAAVSELASVALIICEPVCEPVATNEQLKDPETFDSQGEGDVDWPAPPKVIVIVEEVPNPLPVTVTEVPNWPLEGLGEIDGVDALT